MPDFLVNIGLILFVVFFFGFSVFIHEFGHLLAAVWRGLHIEKFSIGFGQRIWGFTKNKVEFIICLLYTSPSPRDKRQSRMPSSA